MPDRRLILAIDQGTTSTRAILFDDHARAVASAQRELGQIFPRDGWVEHDPEEIWRSTVEVCRETLSACAGEKIVSVGITNQRETTLVWERGSGRPICNAIVWQDRRTADRCDELKADGVEENVTDKTGLLLDPYFSATKLAWILDNVAGARAAAQRGELAFGTTDCFLLWRLTGGRVHATDATNASRTLLFDIHAGDWDEELLDLFGVPASILPAVHDSAADFGETDPGVLGARVSVAGIAGDQQAAALGQACVQPGMVKSTYGTGCFVLLNTGEQAVRSRNRLLSTIAYRIGGQTTYALEGSIFIAGAAVQWLRDRLGVVGSAGETEALAAGLQSNQGVYLVPAFTGLGAPHWDARARGAIFGLTRDSGADVLARAALESVCYQTHDLVHAMREDGAQPTTLRVDGGMVVNDWLVQTLADVLDLEVERPVVTETTALGAAYLAGLQSGVFDSLDDIARRWQRERRFVPAMPASQRQSQLASWHRAVASVRGLVLRDAADNS